MYVSVIAPDIQESIPGITPKVLAKELKDLEQNQLIKRNILEEYPVKITYTLEPYADTLTPIIYSLKDWGINHKKKITDRVQVNQWSWNNSGILISVYTNLRSQADYTVSVALKGTSWKMDLMRKLNIMCDHYPWTLYLSGAN